MRIESISASANFSVLSRTNKQVNNKHSVSGYSPVPLDYGKDLLTFKSVPNEMVKIVKNLPFEEKLAYVFQKMEPAEFLFIVREQAEIKNLLSNLSKTLETGVSRFLVMEIPSIKENFIFGKSPYYDCYFINTNDNPVMVNNRILKPQNTTSLYEGDRIKSVDFDFVFKYEPSTTIDLDNYSSLFLQEYDFTEDYLKYINNFNNKIIDKILYPKKESKSEKITFASVGGQDKAIKQIKRNLIYPIQHPEAYPGFKNKGLLLYGPSGTGKSLLAEATGNEVNISFFSVGGTDFNDKYVGGSEKAFEEQIQKAIDAQPSILFIDEVDSLGRKRGTGDIHGDKLLNKVLHSMTKLQGEEVYLIAATNNLELLDNAFLRAGRFGAQVLVDTPDLGGVERIFDIHIKDKLDKNLDKAELMKSMHSLKMVGADIALAIKDARDNAFVRLGIEDAMDNGTYTPMMLDYLELNQEDFEVALNNFRNKNKNNKVRIGYNK